MGYHFSSIYVTGSRKTDHLVSESLFALSLSFPSERFVVVFSSMLKLLYRMVEMNNTSVTGWF